MFAEIILHRRVPKQFDSFTYKIPENASVKLGQIVKVPFRKQKLSGIVRQIHQKTPSYPTKLIEEISELILPDWQMQLATFLSERYECSFSKVIDLFIPEKVWKGVKTEQLALSRIERLKVKSEAIKDDTTFDTKMAKLGESLLSSTKPKLLLEQTPIPREALYQSLINAIPHDSQILFLFPEVFFLKQLAPKDAVHFYGELPELEKASVWHAVRNCEIQIIAATRTGIFLPFKKLGAVVLDFEHNENYSEKREPRYHTLDVASEMSKLLKIPLITISSTPRVETYYTAHTGIYEKHEWHEKGYYHPIVSIIDMGNERRKGNFGIFAESVLEKIAAHLIQQKQILLFLNRKGEASALLCSDCGTVFRCDGCSGTLAVHSGNLLHCHRCNTKKTMPASCSKCGNAKLKRLGSGTEMVEKEIQKIFCKARVLRLDRESLSKIDEKSLRKADIIIATKIIDKPLHLERFALSIAVMPDSLLHFPDFRATERVFQLLTHIRHLLREKGEIIIQTFMPEHSLWNYMAENRIEDFYASELETRKSLSLPPFNHRKP